MHSLATILSFITLFTLVSCGQSSSGSGRSVQQQTADNMPTSTPRSQNEIILADGSNIQGIYAADLYPVNYNLHFKQVGTAALQRDGDVFSAHVNLKYGPRDTKVKQAVYTGRRCPNLSDDLNKDAYIDMQEALIAIGSVSIPLDGVLDSSEQGAGVYPVGDSVTGQYAYMVTASFSRMFEDLKLNLGVEGVTFPGRVVLLTGIPESVFLPPTVAAAEGQSVHSSLPLACGVLWKVDGLPSF